MNIGGNNAKHYGLVSIITPTYNCGRFIAETIESVLTQTYRDWEMLIVDDCSTDNTRDIVESFHDNRIKYHRLDKNSGAAVARNTALKMANGRWIAFLDSDDLWLPYKLERQLSFMATNDVLVSYTSSLTCDENGKVYAFNPAYKHVSYKQICNCDKCGTTELIYNAFILGKLEMPYLRKRQDWAFKILLLQKAKIAYGMFDTLSMYRIREDSLSRNKIGLIKYNISVYRTILHKSMLGAWSKFLYGFIPSYLKKKLRQKIANSSL